MIGGGQAGLAAGYHLRRLGLDFVILDAQTSPGGAWQHAWDSLHLFSPAAVLLAARPPDAPPARRGLPRRQARRELPDGVREAVRTAGRRPVRVQGVHRDGELLRVETDSGTWHAQAVISATGTWWRPFLPAVPGRADFAGRQLHTVNYRARGLRRPTGVV